MVDRSRSKGPGVIAFWSFKTRKIENRGFLRNYVSDHVLIQLVSCARSFLTFWTRSRPDRTFRCRVIAIFSSTVEFPLFWKNKGLSGHEIEVNKKLCNFGVYQPIVKKCLAFERASIGLVKNFWQITQLSGVRVLWPVKVKTRISVFPCKIRCLSEQVKLRHTVLKMLLKPLWKVVSTRTDPKRSKVMAGQSWQWNFMS